jgi:hypothetical protein
MQELQTVISCLIFSFYDACRVEQGREGREVEVEVKFSIFDSHHLPLGLAVVFGR